MLKTLPPEAIHTADRVRAVVSNPNYTQTIGLWIEQGLRDANHDMAFEEDPTKREVARGRYRAYFELVEQINRALSVGEVAARRIQEEVEKAKERGELE